MPTKRLLKRIIFLSIIPVFLLVGESFAKDPVIKSYLALGDSYTVGTGVNRTKSWPMQLTEMLETEKVSVRTAVIAQAGWTTSDLAGALKKLNLSPGYDLVTLMIGVNNQFRGQNRNSYGYEFEILLNWAIMLAGGRPEKVVVLSIPDWGVSPYAKGRDRAATGKDIDLFNQINYTLTQKHGATYVDVTSLVREIGLDPKMYVSDGLHPTRALHTKWAERVLPAAQKALKIKHNK